jgi:hypothetical protein
MLRFACLGVILALSASAAAQRPVLPARPVTIAPLAGRAITCTTAGDALGKLVLRPGQAGVTLEEHLMSGEVVRYSAPATPADLAALGTGKPVVLVGRTPKTVDFGGAHSPAVVFAAVAPIVAGKQAAVYARGSIVFRVSCGR